MVFNLSARLIPMEPAIVHLSTIDTRGTLWKKKKSRREIPVLQSTVLNNQPQNVMWATFKWWHSFILELEYQSR